MQLQITKRSVAKMKKMKSIILTISFLSCISCERSIKSDRQLVTDELQTIINQFENKLKSDLTKDGVDGSISAAIISENKVIWSKAFGYADRENRAVYNFKKTYPGIYEVQV